MEVRGWAVAMVRSDTAIATTAILPLPPFAFATFALAIGVFPTPAATSSATGVLAISLLAHPPGPSGGRHGISEPASIAGHRTAFAVAAMVGMQQRPRGGPYMQWNSVPFAGALPCTSPTPACRQVPEGLFAKTRNRSH